MLDLPACVVPVTFVDPAKDGKASNVEYFGDTDKLIHDQCKRAFRLSRSLLLMSLTAIADDPEFAAGMPVTVQVYVRAPRYSLI